jgi:hypothetical protein
MLFILTFLVTFSLSLKKRKNRKTFVKNTKKISNLKIYRVVGIKYSRRTVAEGSNK